MQKSNFELFQYWYQRRIKGDLQMICLVLLCFKFLSFLLKKLHDIKKIAKYGNQKPYPKSGIRPATSGDIRNPANFTSDTSIIQISEHYHRPRCANKKISKSITQRAQSMIIEFSSIFVYVA